MMAAKSAKEINSHFYWGRSAWTLLFVSVALVVYAVWWVLAAVLA